VYEADAAANLLADSSTAGTTNGIRAARVKRVTPAA